MHITLNFDTLQSNLPHPAARALNLDARCELLWDCFLSGQMDGAALEREIAANPRFRAYVQATESQAA